MQVEVDAAVQVPPLEKHNNDLPPPVSALCIYLLKMGYLVPCSSLIIRRALPVVEREKVARERRNWRKIYAQRANIEECSVCENKNKDV